MADEKKKRKPRKKKQSNAGRPEIPIDWSMVDRMLAAHCTGKEIAEVIGVHPDTLYNQCQRHHDMNFTDYSAQKRQKGKALLKLTMFQMAMGQHQSQKGEPDKSMLVWLSKNLLGFSDRSEYIMPLNEYSDQEEEQQGVVIILPDNNRQ